MPLRRIASTLMPQLAALCMMIGCDVGMDVASAPIIMDVGSIGVSATVADSVLLQPHDFAVRGTIVAVADRAGPTVRLLDTEGRLQRVLGKRGGGPGEFRTISGVAVSDEGLIAVGDARQRRITFFHRDGSIVGELTLPGRLGAIMFDDQGALHVDRSTALDSTGPIQGSPTIEVYSAAGQLLRQYGNYLPAADPYGKVYLNEVRFARAPDGSVWLLYPYRGLVEERAPSGELRTSIELPSPEGRPRGGPFVEEIPATPGSPPSLAIVRMPVADDIAVDGSGRIHVSVLQTPQGQRMYADLAVFSPEGRELTRQRLRVPARRIAIQGEAMYALRDAFGASVGIDIYAILPDTTRGN